MRLQQIGFRDAEARQFVLRQVDASAPRIFADIADDVGELERQAEVMGVLERLAVAVAEDFRREQADHAGDPVAIQVQRLEIRVTDLVEVHLHAVDDLQQLLLRQREVFQGGHQRLRHRVAGMAFVQRLHFVAPPAQFGSRQKGIGTFVHHVVDLAAEGVERRNRLAPQRFEKQKAVVEARAALRGTILAILVRSHGFDSIGRTSVRQTISGQSRGWSMGRRLKTS